MGAELAAPPEGLDRLEGVHDLEVGGARVRCQVDGDHLDGLLRALTAVGVRTLRHVGDRDAGGDVPAALRGRRGAMRSSGTPG